MTSKTATQVWHHDATTIAAMIRDGEVSAAEVLEEHIRRLDEVEPSLNAMAVPLRDEARSAAAAADAAQARGQEMGPLHGVPMTIKEQYRVRGTQTTLGASRFVGELFDDEGPLVTALRGAGAIILGKTNVMQTLAGWETDNPVYGRTNNPWNLERSPGGSSGGEAALIAVGASALGLGGDLGGSIRVPSHFCGIHGFKPTSHRLTNTDFAPGRLSSGQELFIAQPGPMARSVADLCVAMEVLTATSTAPTVDLAPPVPWTDPATVDVSSLRVGVYTHNGYFEVSPAIRRAVTDAADALRRAGATVVRVRPPDLREGVHLFLRAASAGGSADVFELLAGEKPIPQLAGTLRGARMPGPVRRMLTKRFESQGQEYLADILPHARPSSAAEFFEAVEARNDYVAAFQSKLDADDLDAIICPPVAVPAFTHGASEHLFPAVADAMVYNLLGVPAGVVSTSRVRADDDTTRRPGPDLAVATAAEVDRESVGLPIGVQVVGRHWHDHVVLAVMGAIEDRTGAAPDRPTITDLPI